MASTNPGLPSASTKAGFESASWNAGLGERLLQRRLAQRVSKRLVVCGFQQDRPGRVVAHQAIERVALQELLHVHAAEGHAAGLRRRRCAWRPRPSLPCRVRPMEQPNHSESTMAHSAHRGNRPKHLFCHDDPLSGVAPRSECPCVNSLIYTVSRRKVGGGRSGPAPAAKRGKSRVHGAHAAHDGRGKPGRWRRLALAGRRNGAVQGLTGVLVVAVGLVGRRHFSGPSLAPRSSASRFRAENSRDFTVLSGTPSASLISSYDKSAKCRSTTTSRYSGVRAINAA